MERKYILTNETTQIDGHTLHRIQVVRDFGYVKAGDLGGWIESEDNLSHDGNCWIYEDAKVYNHAGVYHNTVVCDNARIYDDARVYGDVRVCNNARVYGNAIVCANARICGNARIYNNAKVYDSARIYNNAKVCNNAKIYGDVEVYDDAKIYGDVEVYDNARVFGNARIYGNSRIFGNVAIAQNAFITSTSDYLVVGPIGSRNAYTTFYRTEDDIWVSCGCFNDSIDKFEKRVKKAHRGTRHLEDYKHACLLARKKISSYNEGGESNDAFDEEKRKNIVGGGN